MESFLAGGTVLNSGIDSPRYSKDRGKPPHPGRLAPHGQASLPAGSGSVKMRPFLAWLDK